MARTDLTKVTAEGPYGNYGANEADVTMAAADVQTATSSHMRGRTC
jgi:hypothetical protein